MPEIQVTPLQAAALALLARAAGAGRVLEIGTLGGYSTTWLARAVGTGGRVVSLEIDPEHARVARANLDRAGVGDWVEIRVGAADASLRALRSESVPSFDFAFIDADKPGSVGYLRAVLELIRVGGLIVVDNVVRRGDIVDPANRDPNVQGTLDLLRWAGSERRLRCSVLQMVGRKGHDGFFLAVRER